MTTPNEISAALGIARQLVYAGVPVFVAAPDPSKPTGFALPTGWQQTRPDPGVIDLWRPGYALGAVMGCGLDLLDLDARSGADLSTLGCPLPTSYGVATTPSGGVHSFIRSLWIRERDNVAPGIDVKSGLPDGKGRGFAFIAPTVRASKVTGQPTAYRWIRPPDLDRLEREGSADQSGVGLAGLIERLRAREGGDRAPTAEQFMRASPWTVDVDTVLRREGRHAGVLKLAAGLRGRGGWRFDDALTYMRETVWPKIDQTQGGHEYPLEEFEADVADVWTRYPDGNTERATEDAAKLGGPQPESGTPIPGHVALTDTFLADRVAAQCLAGRFLWVPGLEWLAWNGKRWVSGDATAIMESVRRWTMNLYEQAQQAGADSEFLKLIKARQDTTKIEKVVKLCRGIPSIRCDAGALDAYPDLLNTPDGVVNLATGDVIPHDPYLLLTKITRGSYQPGFTHSDWDQALEALPPNERTWFQSRIGQAITGYATPDGVMPILQGGGENGKSALTTDGLLPALGDYAAPASSKLFQGSNEHSTERADLRGQRLLIAEEMTEGRALNTTALKQIQDVGEIKARYLYRDNITFTATHSLFVTTNYMPIVNETDHGTWRRLMVLKFPFTFRKPGEQLETWFERIGDPGLKLRIREGHEGQHDAAVTWAIEGSIRWYNTRDVSLRPTENITMDTRAWRAEADHILGFWQERLIADIDAMVTKMDMLDEFNEWLRTNGKLAWSRELFASRFKDHTETTRHHVTEKRPSDTTGLVRRKAVMGMPRSDEQRPRCYIGVRFRHDKILSDLPESPPGPTGPTQTELISEITPGTGPTHLTSADRSLVQPVQPIPIFSYMRAYVGEDQPPLDRLDQALRDAVASGAELPLDDLSTQAETVPTRSATNGKPPTKAQIRATQKAQAIADAAGPLIELPALVTRSGVVTHVTLNQADIAIGPAIADELTVDVETTGFPVGHVDHELRTVQLGNKHMAVVFDATDIEQAAYVSDVFTRASVLHAHSATADIVPLAHAGLIDAERAWDHMYDTVIPAKLADPASTGSDPALKQLAEAVLPDPVSTPANVDRANLFKAAGWLTDTKVTSPRERSGWAQVDSRCRTMVRYAAADVLDTAALADELPPVAPHLLTRERAAQRLTARVAHRGLRIDGEHVQALLGCHTAARADAADRVRAYGVGNPGSNRQIGARLLGMGVKLPETAKGAPSVAAGVLERLKRDQARWTDVGTFVNAVLDYREHDTALGLFLEPYHQLVQRGDGRARPTVYTLAADTGRMSCVRPNFQQVPREGGFRACIVADPGQLLISADFSSVELRVMAALSQDANMIRMLYDGADIHALIAEQVFGPEWTKGDRYTVKRGVFGWAYSGSIPTLAAQVGVSDDIMASVVDVLAAMAPTYVEWSQSIKALVREGRTQFETYSGRVVHLSQQTPHKAPNYCIQGTARELLVDALLRWQDTQWGTATLFPVHDEIVVSVPESDAEKATETLVEAMNSTLFGVPIVGSPSKPSLAWADAA